MKTREESVLSEEGRLALVTKPGKRHNSRLNDKALKIRGKEIENDLRIEKNVRAAFGVKLES